MLRRTLCCLLTAVFVLTACTAAVADKPREIYPLEYDELPMPRKGQYHYLFACVDTWEGQANNLGNTDGVLLITLDTEAQRALITTFSREMLVKRPDGGIGRFTYITKNYGPEALCRTVSTHFGVKVDKYVIFSMDDVQTIIDALGGVEITVTDAEADYLNRYRISRDSTTPSMGKGGTYLFGGHAAVIYMRIRKVGGDGDAGRTRRIRTVLTTLAGKFTNADMNDVLSLLSSINTHSVLTNMTMDDLIEAAGAALQLRGVTPEGIQMPPDDAMEPITYAGMQTRQVDFEMARSVLQTFIMGNEFLVVGE